MVKSSAIEGAGKVTVRRSTGGDYSIFRITFASDVTLSGWTEWVFVFTNGGAQRGRPDLQPRDIHHLIFGFIYSTEYRKRFGAP